MQRQAELTSKPGLGADENVLKDKVDKVQKWKHVDCSCRALSTLHARLALATKAEA